jgi:transcription elongation factor Elf1
VRPSQNGEIVLTDLPNPGGSYNEFQTGGKPLEHVFTCPYCGEEISMVLDLSINRQTYVEDCEVCCKPIQITFTVEDDELASFTANTLN